MNKRLILPIAYKNGICLGCPYYRTTYPNSRESEGVEISAWCVRPHRYCEQTNRRKR